jgi:aldehyde dehydrogenase (NAD+)
MQAIDTGMIGAEIQLPLGGTKATGNGHREAGQAALAVNYRDRLQRALIDDSAQSRAGGRM